MEEMSLPEIQRWLAQRGGMADRSIKWETQKDPRDPREEIRVAVETYVAKNGERLVVRKTNKSTEPRQAGEAAAEDSEGSRPFVRDPIYAVDAAGDPTPSTTEARDSRSPEKREEDAEMARERQWNRDNGPSEDNPYGRGSGLYESHSERAAREMREQQEEDRRSANERQVRAQEQANTLAQQREAREAENQAADNALATRRFDWERENADRAAARADRPQLVGGATDTQRQIATFDPTTGTLTAQSNPLYDEAKVESARKREELATAIQLNQLSAAEATREYSRWFDETVKVPFMQAAEARAQAQEQRAALEAEERRRQFAANFELQKGELGERAAGRATQAEINMLPYRTGPKFGGEMSAAINSLAGGGSLESNASEGINFSAGSFQFKRPNIEGIAKKAAANAIKGISSYRPLEQSFASGGGGVPQVNFGSAPQTSGNPYNLQQMFNQMTNYQYGGAPPDPNIPVNSGG